MPDAYYESFDAWDAAGQPPRDAYKEHVERKRVRENPVVKPEERETVAEKSARLSTWPKPTPKMKPSDWVTMPLALLAWAAIFCLGPVMWVIAVIVACTVDEDIAEKLLYIFGFVTLIGICIFAVVILSSYP